MRRPREIHLGGGKHGIPTAVESDRSHAWIARGSFAGEIEIGMETPTSILSTHGKLATVESSPTVMVGSNS